MLATASSPSWLVCGRRLVVEERIAETAAIDGWAGSHDPIEYVRDRALNEGRYSVQNVPVNLDLFQTDQHRATQVSLLRCIFGNPYRPKKVDASWLSWNDRAIPRAAAAAYEERSLPSGHLDNARLAVIADMLEEAGCRDDEVLGHLRKADAVHVRGCWCVDLLLGKE